MGLTGPDRRTVLRAAFGLGAATVVGSATGCVDPSLRTSAAARDLTRWRAARLDWRRHEGTELILGGSAHQWVIALQPLIGAFHDLTGITVRLDISGEDQFSTKLPIAMDSGSSTPDVLMVPASGQAVGAGWLEPLDGYLHDPAVTDAAWYSADDVFPSADKLVTADDGLRYGLPITAEIQTTFYRTDLLDRAPETFEETEAEAARLRGRGELVGGIALRGKPTAGAVAWPAAGWVFSHGGYLVDPAGRPSLDSPQTIAGVQSYADTVRSGAPQGSATWDWLEINAAMQQGRVAMLQDSSNAAADLIDPDKSRISDRLGVGLLPAHAGMRKPNLYHWVIGMNVTKGCISRSTCVG